jgi:oxaloacetate decarboxylase alpha subunit
MAVAVRYSKQDPWERLRLFRSAAPETRLLFLTTGLRFILWETASHEVMVFAFRLLVNNGIDRFAMMDLINNVPAMRIMADLACEAGGGDVVAALTPTLPTPA